MEAWKQVADLGYFSTAQDIDTALSTPISFANGSTAMLLIGSWQEATLIKAGMVPGKDFGAFIVPPINPAVGWQAIFETGPVVVSAHNSDEQAALNSVNTFMEPSVQVKWDGLESFVSAESSVKTTDPTAISVNNEIAAEHVHLMEPLLGSHASSDRRPGGLRPVQVHPQPQPAPDAVPNDVAGRGHVLLVDGQVGPPGTDK